MAPTLDRVRPVRLATIGAATLALSAVAVGQWSLSARPLEREGPRGDQGGVAGIGPDVIVAALPNISNWGTVGGISAYSIGTTSCNIGDAVLAWYSSTNQHPVIAQNMYRLKDGRFEMIGMSWLKHGFCALSGTLCGPCQSTSCATLGIGCSDPYSSGLNGSQSNLGPRSQVNATSGFFPYPFSAPAAAATIGRRLQVLADDLNPSMNAGALYFGEGHYITPDEPAHGTDLNNAAYRQILVGGISSGTWQLSLAGPTHQQKAAIWAWKEHGLGIGQPDPDVQIEAVDVPGDGRFLVGFKATDLGDGWWNYEYAVHNYNSHRSGGSFRVPLPAGVEVSEIGFHGVPHHSGEPYATQPWSASIDGDAIVWRTQPYAVNPNANALRWSTLYNFRFNAAAAPMEVEAVLGLFRPGDLAAVEVTVLGPAAPEILGDLNGDGVVNGIDLGILLAAWGAAGGAADLDGNGVVDAADLAILLAAWE